MSKPSRSDARLFARALSQGWRIPAKQRTEIVRALCAIIGAQDATARERTSAARALMQASRVELDAIRVAQGAHYEDLIRRLEALEGEGGTDGELAAAAGEDRATGAASGVATARRGPLGLVRRGVPVRPSDRGVPGAPEGEGQSAAAGG